VPAQELVQARQPALAPAPPLRPPFAPPAAPLQQASVSRPFAVRTAPGASLRVLRVPLVPLVPRVPRVLVPVRGLLVSPHAAPPLQRCACAPFFAVLPRRGS